MIKVLKYRIMPEPRGLLKLMTERAAGEARALPDLVHLSIVLDLSGQYCAH